MTVDIPINASLLQVILPLSQVLVSYNPISCYVLNSSILSKLACQISQNTLNISNSDGWIGTNTIVIYGFINVNFHKILSDTDSIQISLFNS